MRLGSMVGGGALDIGVGLSNHGCYSETKRRDENFTAISEIFIMLRSG